MQLLVSENRSSFTCFLPQAFSFLGYHCEFQSLGYTIPGWSMMNGKRIRV
ncbi:hypothetical protein NC653_032842 [Populus alba x Populus x berolinensis]|uniref:Uncharacterized protein n=1 Tax=Populus alba x Populus x berolinensis TaxID=444605 RepID=A0AAD6Q092_9ROSI|nr:hypothetical protein NC653_032842 [Populus alba x Populus x berolinensis]